jgi:hypothetical protein
VHFSSLLAVPEARVDREATNGASPRRTTSNQPRVAPPGAWDHGDSCNVMSGRLGLTSLQERESKDQEITPHCEDKSLQDEENMLLVFTVAGICN